jgi:hypothetical protein
VNLHKQTLLQETTMSLSAVEQTKQPYSIEKKQMPACFELRKADENIAKIIDNYITIVDYKDLMENC